VLPIQDIFRPSRATRFPSRNSQHPRYQEQRLCSTRTAGKLWVRERVLELLDKGSLGEVGSVAGTVQWKKLEGNKGEPESYVPRNSVQGFETLRGRKMVFGADDFSIWA